MKNVIILNGGCRGSGVSEFILQEFNGHDELVLAHISVLVRTILTGGMVVPSFTWTLFHCAVRLRDHTAPVTLQGELRVDPIVELALGDCLRLKGHSFENSLEESARH